MDVFDRDADQIGEREVREPGGAARGADLRGIDYGRVATGADKRSPVTSSANSNANSSFASGVVRPVRQLVSVRMSTPTDPATM